MLEKFNLNKKNAVITGAAGLLGKEHCLALMEVNCNVIAVDIDLERLENFKNSISKKYNKQLSIYKLDITSENNLINFTKKYTKVDILINNAAIDLKIDKSLNNKIDSTFEEFDLKRWNKELSVGLTGAMLCSKHIGNLMIKNGGGVMLNIASDLSIIAPNQSLYKTKENPDDCKPITYSVVKTGLIGLTRYLATYWAEKNIRVNALSPGPIKTLASSAIGDFNYILKWNENNSPLKRNITVDDISGSAIYLLSDLSSGVTGEIHHVDSGYNIIGMKDTESPDIFEEK